MLQLGISLAVAGPDIPRLHACPPLFWLVLVHPSYRGSIRLHVHSKPDLFFWSVTGQVRPSFELVFNNGTQGLKLIVTGCTMSIEIESWCIALCQLVTVSSPSTHLSTPPHILQYMYLVSIAKLSQWWFIRRDILNSSGDYIRPHLNHICSCSYLSSLTVGALHLPDMDCLSRSSFF